MKKELINTIEQGMFEPVNKSGHEKYYFLNLIFKSRH